jgi:Tfp pilus assembly protein PilV
MKTSISRIAAFSLVEVAVAIAITSFCLIALLGLLPVGLKSSQASIEQTAANGIISELTADLRATPPTVPPGAATASQQFLIPIPANPVTAPTIATLKFTSDGLSSADPTVTGPWSYLVTITFLTNGPNARTATFVELQVSWPAAATLANAAGSVQTFVALDRN